MKKILLFASLFLSTLALMGQVDQLTFKDFKLVDFYSPIDLRGARDLKVSYVADVNGEPALLVSFNTESPEGRKVLDVKFVTDGGNKQKVDFNAQIEETSEPITELLQNNPMYGYDSYYSGAIRTVNNDGTPVFNKAKRTTTIINPDGTHTIYNHKRKTATTFHRDGSATVAKHDGNHSIVIAPGRMPVHSFYNRNPYSLNQNGRWAMRTPGSFTQFSPSGNWVNVMGNGNSSVINPMGRNPVLVPGRDLSNDYLFNPPNIITRDLLTTRHEVTIPLSAYKSSLKRSKTLVVRVTTMNQRMDVYLKGKQLKKINQAL